MARTVEQSRTLDVNWFSREGLLQPNQSGVVTWTRERDGKETGSIAYVAVSDDDSDVTALRLVYTISTRWTDESRCVDYEVALEWTPCNFDGERRGSAVRCVTPVWRSSTAPRVETSTPVESVRDCSISHRPTSDRWPRYTITSKTPVTDWTRVFQLVKPCVSTTRLSSPETQYSTAPGTHRRG